MVHRSERRRFVHWIVGTIDSFSRSASLVGSEIQLMTDLYLLIVGTFVTVIWIIAVVLFIWEQKSEKSESE